MRYRLEERLGARLLNRRSRQLALMEFGRTIADSAIRLYREAEAGEGNVREMAARPKGLVRLAVPMAFGLRWIAPLRADFFREYPDIEIDSDSGRIMPIESIAIQAGKIGIDIDVDT